MRSGRAPLLAAMRSASSRVLIWGTSGQFRWIEAKRASQVTGSFGAASNFQFTIQSGPTSSRTSATVNISARRCGFSCTRETSDALFFQIVKIEPNIDRGYRCSCGETDLQVLGTIPAQLL